MGLGISVGFLSEMKRNDSEGYQWAKRMFATVNDFLRSEGQETWTEAEDLPNLGMRPHVDSFPYSFIHTLRRAYARAVELPDTELLPCEGQGLTSEDEDLIADASCMMSSHLLCHSDCEGLYVPIKFRGPLFDTDERGVPGGGMLGSSYGLLDELRFVAPRLGVVLEAGELSDAEAMRIHTISTDDSHPWSRELIVFLSLWEAASASVRHKTAIVFT